jgi:hypothetical protein
LAGVVVSWSSSTAAGPVPEASLRLSSSVRLADGLLVSPLQLVALLLLLPGGPRRSSVAQSSSMDLEEITPVVERGGKGCEDEDEIGVEDWWRDVVCLWCCVPL